PRAEALARPPHVRRRGAANADQGARSAGAALRRVGRGRAGMGGGRAASVLDGLLPPRGLRQLRARTRRDRERWGLRRRRGCRRGRRDPDRDRERRDDRGRCTARVGGVARVRGVGSTGPPRSEGSGVAGAGPGTSAVIFDLWETLIDWDEEAAARMVERIDALAGPGFRGGWDRPPDR